MGSGARVFGSLFPFTLPESAWALRLCLSPAFLSPPGQQGHTHCVLSLSPNRTSPQKWVSRPPRAPGQSFLLGRHRPGSPQPLSSPFPWPGPVALHGPAFHPDSEYLQIRLIGSAPSRSLGCPGLAPGDARGGGALAGVEDTCLLCPRPHCSFLETFREPQPETGQRTLCPYWALMAPPPAPGHSLPRTGGLSWPAKEGHCLHSPTGGNL